MRDGGGGVGREAAVTVGRTGADAVAVLRWIVDVVVVGRVGPGHDRVVDAVVVVVGFGFD